MEEDHSGASLPFSIFYQSTLVLEGILSVSWQSVTLVSNTDNHHFDADGDRHLTCKEEVGANALAFPTSVILP